VLKIIQPVQMEWQKHIICQVTQAAASKLAGQVFVAFHFLKIIFIYAGDIIFNTEISGFRKTKRRLVGFNPRNVLRYGMSGCVDKIQLFLRQDCVQ
jgi:hypothetical protein